MGRIKRQRAGRFLEIPEMLVLRNGLALHIFRGCNLHAGPLNRNENIIFVFSSEMQRIMLFISFQSGVSNTWPGS